MGKSFDDLFNDFFGRKITPKKITPKKITPKKIEKDDDNNDMRKVFERLSKSLDGSLDNSEIEDLFDSNLGEPDSIEIYEENGLFYEKQSWFTETGEIVKLSVSNDPNIIGDSSKILKPIEEQLAEAIKNEDYERAAILRDSLTPQKRKRGRPKKNVD